MTLFALDADEHEVAIVIRSYQFLCSTVPFDDIEVGFVRIDVFEELFAARQIKSTNFMIK